MGLLDNLVAYWKLDDDLVDAHAAFDLTDSGTTGFAAGKINNGLNPTGTTFAYHADDAAFSPGDTSFSFSVWVNLTNKAVTRSVLGKSAAGGEEYQLEYNSGADRFQFWIHNGDYRIASADTLGSPSTGVWYHLVVWYDAAADTVNIVGNAGSTDSTGSITPGPTDGTSLFRIGAYGSTPDNPMNGVIDEVGYWSRALTSQERTDLYNGGSGLAYSSFTSGGGGGPVIPVFMNHYTQQGAV